MKSIIVALVLTSILAFGGMATEAELNQITAEAGQPAPSVPRDSRGRIRRSPEVRREFQREHPCPSTGKGSGSCPGYVVDHRTALCKGGPDEVGNMQWQTTADGKAKDKLECK